MKKYIFLSVLLLTSSSLFGQLFTSYGLETGLIYSLNSSSDGAPSPILPFFGVSGEIEINERITLTPSMLLTGNYYLWSEEEDKAIPAEIEFADSVWFLSILLDIPVTFSYRIREKIMLNWSVSPAFVLKVPMKTWGRGEDYRSDMLEWFYKGRFIFLEAGSGVKWNYSDTKSFGLEAGILYPVYHLWEGKDYLDQVMFKLGFIFSFNRKKEAS